MAFIDDVTVVYPEIDLGNVVGPQGPKGDKGDKGDPGDGGSLTYTIGNVGSGSFRNITSSDMEALSGGTTGKVFIVIPNADITFDGKSWYGPYLSTMKYYQGTSWVDVSGIKGCKFNKGQAMFLWIKGSGSYSIDQCYLLNPPMETHVESDWHVIDEENVDPSIASDVTIYYKKSGDTVSVRFTGFPTVPVTGNLGNFAILPEGYYSTDYDMIIPTCNLNDSRVFIFIDSSEGSLHVVNEFSDSAGCDISPEGWNTTQFSFTI